eukprot:Nitzschia sp. Nitz4//scaffold27_size158506//93537//94109//NITZ4_002606-RA/size158506-processed-gene-0.82-mRNA-1//-1//CDS//3329545506//885//frame0
MKVFKKLSLRRKGRKNKVHFSSKPTVHELPALPVPVAKEELWYERGEARRIQSEYLECMKRVQRGQASSTEMDEEDYRGLEGLEDEARQRTWDFREAARSAVFSSQEAQSITGCINPEAIARVYAQVTEMAKEIAFNMARMDEEYVEGAVRGVLSKKSRGSVCSLSTSEHTASTGAMTDFDGSALGFELP